MTFVDVNVVCQMYDEGEFSSNQTFLGTKLIIWIECIIFGGGGGGGGG